jgi:hypothetical protein
MLPIKRSPSGSQWQTVSSYEFTYDPTPLTSDDHECDNGPSGLCEGGTASKLALRTVQRFGKNGGPLPALTFTYGRNIGSGYWVNGAWNRLTEVNNGHGGIVTFSYENISAAVSGQYGNIFKNNRRVTAKAVQDGMGHTDTWFYSYQEPGDITRPAYNTLGSTFDLDPNPIVVNYDLGPNTHPNSATVYYAKRFNGDNSADLIHKWRQEFRGHRYGAATDPNGNVTERWFYQGDARPGEDPTPCIPSTTGQLILTDSCWLAIRNREQLKGKEYRTVVHQGGTSGPKLSETKHTYSVNHINYGYDATDTKAGLWRFFNYESQTEAKSWDGGGTALTKTTTYTYDLNNYTCSGGRGCELSA